MPVNYRYKDDPRIPVSLSNKGNRITVNFIVDSGSTCSFLPRPFAEVLELDLSGEKLEAKGMSGPFRTIKSKVAAHLLKIRKRFTLDVLVFEDENIDYAVLGREGFFSLFDITFCHNNRRIRLKEWKAKPHQRMGYLGRR